MSRTETDTPEALSDMLASRRRPWLPWTALGLAALAGVALYAIGAAPKREARREAVDAARQADSAVRRVLTATVRRADETLTLRQPATLEPARRALVFAQVAGYLSDRRVDAGDRVTAGQVLGVISTPVLEKELLEARSSRAAAAAQLDESRLALDLSTRTLERITAAAAAGATSRQDVDDAQTQVRRATSGVERSAAALDQADAAIARLERLLEFRELRAPFDGIVTRRTRDQGDYIEVGGNTTDPAVFTLVDSSRLRTVVRVPQAQAYLVSPGQPARIRVAGLGTQPITGVVTRVSGELDQASRTMPIEVEVDNADARLIAGSFATVEITVKRSEQQRPLLIPGNALMLLPTAPGGSGGPTVGVLAGPGPQHELEYRAVALGRDLGSEVEVLSGLTPGDRVVLNIPVPLPPATRVEIVEPPAPLSPPSPPSPATSPTPPTAPAQPAPPAPPTSTTPAAQPSR